MLIRVLSRGHTPTRCGQRVAGSAAATLVLNPGSFSLVLMQVKRCDEMARKIRFFHDQASSACRLSCVCEHAAGAAGVISTGMYYSAVTGACGTAWCQARVTRSIQQTVDLYTQLLRSRVVV